MQCVIFTLICRKDPFVRNPKKSIVRIVNLHWNRFEKVCKSQEMSRVHLECKKLCESGQIRFSGAIAQVEYAWFTASFERRESVIKRIGWLRLPRSDLAFTTTLSCGSFIYSCILMKKQNETGNSHSRNSPRCNTYAWKHCYSFFRFVAQGVSAISRDINARFSKFIEMEKKW